MFFDYFIVVIPKIETQGIESLRRLFFFLESCSAICFSWEKKLDLKKRNTKIQVDSYI